MKLKLDENFGQRGADLLRGAGHDVATVAEEKLCGAVDAALLDVCGAEGRCLVTLDLDFANPLRFPPERYAGIAVLRLPDRATRSGMSILLQTLVGGLSRDEIAGRLWIVEPGRIRTHDANDDDLLGE